MNDVIINFMPGLEKLNPRNIAALSGSILALAAPDALASKPLNREIAHPRMERTADKLGAEVLRQFRLAREAADPNATLEPKGRSRLIKLVKPVEGQGGSPASYVLQASMGRSRNNRLDPRSTSGVSIEAVHPGTATKGNPSTETGVVFSFELQKFTDSFCPTEDCRTFSEEKKVMSWLSTVTYTPETDVYIPGPGVSSPDGSRVMRQMVSTPFPIELGGDGKSTTVYPQEFKSQVEDAEAVLIAADRDWLVPANFKPPSNFNTFK